MFSCGAMKVCTPAHKIHAVQNQITPANWAFDAGISKVFNFIIGSTSDELNKNFMQHSFAFYTPPNF